MTIKEIKAIIAEMPQDVRIDLNARIKACRDGRISKADVIRNAKNTVEWLKANDRFEEVTYYQKFADSVESL